MHACPFCETRTDRPWATLGEHLVYECTDCGVVFFPRPVATPEYDDYYPYLRDFDDARFQWELAIRRGKYRHQLALMRRHLPGARRLTDVGAGPGYFCKVALEQGWDAVGVETSAPAVAAGTQRFGVRYVALGDVPAASQDVITCHHVIEHLEQPGAFLETVRQRLAPGGLLVVHVPHREPLTFAARTSLDRLRRGAGVARRCQLYYPEHISGFDLRSLPRAVTRFGFECLEVRSVSMWSRHYDPFFFASYFRDLKGKPLARPRWRALAVHAARCAGDNVGDLIGRGDWVVATFRAALKPRR